MKIHVDPKTPTRRWAKCPRCRQAKDLTATGRFVTHTGIGGDAHCDGSGRHAATAKSSPKRKA